MKRRYDFLDSYNQGSLYELPPRWIEYAQTECIFVEGVESGSFSPEAQAILVELGAELKVPLYFTGKAKTRLFEETISDEGDQSAQGRPDIEGQRSEVGSDIIAYDDNNNTIAQSTCTSSHDGYNGVICNNTAS